MNFTLVVLAYDYIFRVMVAYPKLIYIRSKHSGGCNNNISENIQQRSCPIALPAHDMYTYM